MTQLSYNTIAYDQIIRLVSRLIGDYNDNRYGDNSKLVEEYQSLIDKLNNHLSRPHRRA